MFTQRHYVPILKGKRAEFPAVGKLKEHGHITPLFEAVPNRAATQIPKDMEACDFPTAQPYFIDMVFWDDEDDSDATVSSQAGDDHPVIICFEESAKRGQSAIPVTGTNRSQVYQDAVRQIIEKQENGVAIRLTPDDFDDDTDLPTALDNLLEFLAVDYTDADLIIDIGSVVQQNAQVVAQIHRANLDLTPRIDDWRTLTVATAAFPVGLGGLTGGTWNPIPRVDWQAWEKLVTGTKKPKRLPSYSDYGIASPFLPPTGRVTILAQLRYSTPTSFQVWKGKNVSKDGYGQFVDICKDLVQRGFYRGASFSDGDWEIERKATNGGSSGNPEQWRKIGNNHHFETVLDQIANLP